MKGLGPRKQIVVSSNMEITNELTQEGIDKIKVGQILMFRKDNKRIDLKITRKAKGRVWAKETRTYSEEEMKDFVKDVRRIKAK